MASAVPLSSLIKEGLWGILVRKRRRIFIFDLQMRNILGIRSSKRAGFLVTNLLRSQLKELYFKHVKDKERPF